MAWTEDVRACVHQLPAEFSLPDLDAFLPRLHRLHPNNLHVREKVRQQLQILRDLGEVQFVEPGRYRRLDHQDGTLQLKPGQETSRAELADMMEMKGPAALHRGMFKRSSGPFANDLLLFHHAQENPYGDMIDGDDRIIYVGQGQKGDQVLDGYNLDLANHLENGTRVHFFVKDSRTSTSLRYEGQVLLDKVERVYREEQKRSVLQFHLIPDRHGARRSVYGRAYQEVLEENLESHIVAREATVQVVRRALRDRAFAAHVLAMYRNRCAVCGDTLAHPDEPWIDLQAAHVRAVAAGGPDARNNGMCLCARHHWAFDHGIFSFDNGYRVKMHRKATDPHGELRQGADIRLPDDQALWPHGDYLAWHRHNWRLN